MATGSEVIVMNVPNDFLRFKACCQLVTENGKGAVMIPVDCGIEEYRKWAEALGMMILDNGNLRWAAVPVNRYFDSEIK
ncbi:hypothetical protein CCP4SC76_7640021 [Gammaproteobacteria bacterium]